jgi:hypothetical protein
MVKRIEERMKIQEEKNRKEKGDAWFSKLMKKIGF